MRQFYVYILSNPSRTATYTGVTNDLLRRVYEHKTKVTEGFTARYNVVDLVYFEVGHTAGAAILREKQIKSWSRQRKIDLINGMNPKWRDLTAELLG